MTFNVWSTLSVAVIFATMVLQIINFRKFSKDGSNSTRITLMVKEFFFIGHAYMLYYVRETIENSYPAWFSNMFGLFYFAGLCCLFAVYLKGFTQDD